MQIDKPQVFIGHSFYIKEDESKPHRVDNYRILVESIFTNDKYSIQYGDGKSFEDDEDTFKEIRKIINSSQYGIFDLTEFDPEKLQFVINLNVLLEAGVGLGASVKNYIIAPKQHIMILTRAISNFAGRNIRDYDTNVPNDLERVFKEVEERINFREAGRIAKDKNSSFIKKFFNKFKKF